MKSKIKIFLLIFPINLLIGQNYSNTVSNSLATIQNIVNEVGLKKIEKSGKIDGSFYFFKSPNNANIKLSDSERALIIKVNYNLRK